MELFQGASSSLAIITEERLFSYEELKLEALRKAQELSLGGAFPGSRIAFVAKSSVETIITFLAVHHIGASPLLLSTRYPEKQLEKLIQKGRAHFFLHLPSFTLVKKGFSPPFPQQILLFTSGTTKEPKLVCHSFEAMLFGAKMALPKLQLEENSSWLLSVPFFHVSGLAIIFRALASGSSMTFDAAKATHASFVEFHLRQLVERKLFLPSLKFLLVGGGPVSSQLLKGSPFPLHITYGMTETGSQITMTDENPLEGAGFPLPGREISFSKEGEILVRGKMLFSGYDGAPSPFLPGGWFPTGDLGRLLSSGALDLKGRKNTMIISGGENISPEEVEKALLLIPNILRAAVVPKQDKEYGQRPVAFLEVQGTFPSTPMLQEKLQELLPKFAVPVDFYPLPEKNKKEIKINKNDLLIEINNRLL